MDDGERSRPKWWRDAAGAGPPSDVGNGRLLPVLQRASHDELYAIVKHLNRSWDVRVRRDERIEAAQHDLTRVPYVVEEYVLRAGGNALANLYRGGRGPEYEEVLRDVCAVMKVGVEPGATNVAVEAKMLLELMDRVWASMSPTDRQNAIEDAQAQLRAADKEAGKVSGSALWVLPLSALAAQAGAQLTGFLVYQLAVQVANVLARQMVGYGLALAANAALVRVLAVAIGPLGWIASAGWLAVDLAGPSYKGLAPAVFTIATLRQQMILSDEGVPT